MGEKLHPELEQLRAVFQRSFIQVEFFETTEELKGHFTFALLFRPRAIFILPDEKLPITNKPLYS